ncbi:MAG: hypothetical protein DDT36_00162 [Firmicutes bacterium]|nr:hypothetical protein [Bacillota bacterium]
MSGACFGLILYASTMVGLIIAKSYRDRPRQLQSIRTGIEMLVTEIVYAATPLSVALENVSQSQAKPAAEFFALTGRGIAEFMPVRQSWAMGLAYLQTSSALLWADLEALRLLGEVLGVSNRDDQERHLLLACRRLEALYANAVEEAARNERMWQFLGILIGVVVVIVIL